MYGLPLVHLVPCKAIAPHSLSHLWWAVYGLVGGVIVSWEVSFPLTDDFPFTFIIVFKGTVCLFKTSKYTCLVCVQHAALNYVHLSPPSLSLSLSFSLPPQVLLMAMAQVFIPSPRDSMRSSLHLPTPTSPSLLSPPPSATSSYTDEDHIEFLPRAPPPSPEMQQKQFGPLFEIDPCRFEEPRKSELPPSPTNSLDFSNMFTPNKSPLESEPHSPMQEPSPGDPLDSAYCSAHTSTSSRQSNTGSSLSIPISPNSATSSCFGATFSYSHSDGDAYRNGMRSRTIDFHDGYQVSGVDAPSPSSSSLRPRSHTHPSHSLAPHATYLHEQQHHQYHHREDSLHSVHPHLPHSFNTTQLSGGGGGGGAALLDTRYHHHHDTDTDPSFHRKKSNLKRKSNELGYEVSDSMEAFSCDSCFSGGGRGRGNLSEPEWMMKGNKKPCQEGKNPVIRRQSSSFSGALSYSSSLSPVRDGMSNVSAPPTPNHCTTPLLQQDFVSFLHRHPSSSMTPASFSSPLNQHHSPPYPVTPTPTFSSVEAAPTSLQSMEVGGEEEEGGLDSLDSMDCGTGEPTDLNLTLRRNQASHNPLYPPILTPTDNIVTLKPPQPPGRIFSSGGGGYDFGLDPQLDQGPQGCEVYYSSYHESSQNLLNSSDCEEARLLLSKSL